MSHKLQFAGETFVSHHDVSNKLPAPEKSEMEVAIEQEPQQAIESATEQEPQQAKKAKAKSAD